MVGDFTLGRKNYWLSMADASPEAINSARTAANVRCIGNRVCTGGDDIEAYFAIPGLQLGAVEEKRAVIVRANQERGDVPPRARRRDADGVG